MRRKVIRRNPKPMLESELPFVDGQIVILLFECFDYLGLLCLNLGLLCMGNALCFRFLLSRQFVG